MAASLSRGSDGAACMSQESLYAVISSGIVASLGLWWFRLVLVNVRKMQLAPRLGVYALIWLAYFILTMKLIEMTA